MRLRRTATALLAGLLAFALGAPPAAAEDGAGDELEEILGGFDDEDDAAPAPEVPPGDDAGAGRFWDLGGSLSLGAAYDLFDHRSSTGTRYGGLSSLRLQLSLELDLDLPREWRARISGYGFYDFAYRIRGRSRYTDGVLDDYEWDVELQELYLQGSLLDDLDLKVGRQVVNWGRSDTLRVLDVLNPLDNREPGLVDIEDLRRPVGMLRLDYYLGAWSVTGILIPEIRVDRNPPLGSDFYPDLGLGDLLDAARRELGVAGGVLETLFPALRELPDDRPARFSSRPEWALALTGIFRGWDVSFHLARLHENTPRVALVPLRQRLAVPGLPPIEADLVDARLAYDRITLVGAGANYTFGSWLAKLELAYLDGLGFDFIESLGVPVVIGSTKRSRIDAMGGVEYYGIDETTIALEVVNRHLTEFDDALRGFPNYAQRNLLEVALRVEMDFMNERLHLTLLGVAFGETAQDGSFARISADYELSDALEVGGGVLLYQSGDLPAFSSIGSNDRLFLKLEYHF